MSIPVSDEDFEAILRHLDEPAPEIPPKLVKALRQYDQNVRSDLDGHDKIKRLQKACQSMSHALGRIDYAVGEPNDMECSIYDTFPDEDAVVERVQKRIQDLESALRACQAACVNLPDDALGRDPESGYPYLDELRNNINKALGDTK